MSDCGNPWRITIEPSKSNVTTDQVVTDNRSLGISLWGLGLSKDDEKHGHTPLVA